MKYPIAPSIGRVLVTNFIGNPGRCIGIVERFLFLVILVKGLFRVGYASLLSVRFSSSLFFQEVPFECMRVLLNRVH